MGILSPAKAFRLKRFSSPYWVLRKWLFIYLLVIVLPAGIMMVSFYQRSASIMEEELSETMLQTIRQAGINLSYRLEGIRDISNSTMMNPYLFTYLSESEGNAWTNQQLQTMKNLNLLVQTVQNNKDVFRVRFFINKSKPIFVDWINHFPMESLQTKSWYDKVVAANGLIYWSGVYFEKFIDHDGAYIYSSARILRDPSRYNEVSGMMLIDVTENTITNMVAGVKLPKHSLLYLVDQEGIVIWHPDRTRIGMKLPYDKLLQQGNGYGEGIVKTQVDDMKMVMLFANIGETAWKLVAEIPALELSKRALQQGRANSLITLIAVSMLFLTLMFVLLSFIIRGINRRLQHIIATIHREGVEWMEGSPAPDGDFIMLESSVDRLILRAKMLMEQTYRAQMLEREAQLRALQAQINPHFLYNTLDTINWIAIGRNATDISRMIEGLAKYFRLSLSKGRDVVSVADEITLARVYLDIQQTRFPSSFQYETEVEDGLDNYVMPKLILQPIVENALLHGIHETKTKCGIIRITVKRIDDELLLTVCDDGLGMEEGKVKQLLAGPHIESELDGVGSSYGLYNVNERIRMYSGDQYGLSIISSLGKGTTVTLRLKAVMQKSAQ